MDNLAVHLRRQWTVWQYTSEDSGQFGSTPQKTVDSLAVQPEDSVQFGSTTRRQCTVWQYNQKTVYSLAVQPEDSGQFGSTPQKAVDSLGVHLA